jgi:hypothetical protein
MFCAILLASVTLSCQSNQIPDVRVCHEIPFLDAPEGACIWSASHKEELISAGAWAKLRPYQLIIDPDGWRAIKTGWLQACRMAGPNCQTQVDSIDSLIKAIDGVASGVLKP